MRLLRNNFVEEGIMTASISRTLKLAVALGATALLSACVVEERHPHAVVEYREERPVYVEPAPPPPPGVTLGVHVH